VVAIPEGRTQILSCYIIISKSVIEQLPPPIVTTYTHKFFLNVIHLLLELPIDISEESLATK
jgi:hypothetical protein